MEKKTDNLRSLNDGKLAFTETIDRRQFQVDWDNVKTVEDLKRLLATFRFVFHGSVTVEGVKDLVKEVK